MDNIYKIDTYISLILSKLHICCNYFKRENNIKRFVKRFGSTIEYQSYQQKNDSSNKIWIFWAQGKEKMPISVRKCYDSVIKNQGSLQTILIDMTNYSKYVDIPEQIVCKTLSGSISLTHFSDILRFSLLSKWGGWWLDATVFVTSKITKQNSLFTIRQMNNYEYISKARWTSFLWFIPPNYPMSIFLRNFLVSYWLHYNTIVDYFLMDYIISEFYDKNQHFRSEIDNLPISNEYLYLFQSKLCELPYDEKKWEEMILHTTFMKINWRKEMIKEQNGQKTYYGQLLG